jgi:hypothetical protein
MLEPVGPVPQRGKRLFDGAQSVLLVQGAPQTLPAWASEQETKTRAIEIIVGKKQQKKKKR